MSEKFNNPNKIKQAGYKLGTGLLITSVISTGFVPQTYADIILKDGFGATTHVLGLEESSLNATTEESSTSESSQTTETEETSSSSSTTESSQGQTGETSTTSSSSSSSSSSSNTGSSSNTSSNSNTSSTSSSKPKDSVSGSRPSSSSQSSSSSSKGKKDKEKTTSKDRKPSANGIISYRPNQTTQQFIDKIGKQARMIGDQNDLYASVMIAQAILESASGNSVLAREPNFNLFGIKGSYRGQNVSLPTLEDNGSGKMYSVKANFRKYPSYKESLEDYARLIKGGTGSSNSFYVGTWKSKTKNYQEATAYLTGRYATDTRYNEKLNGLIKAYDLQQYDNAPKVKRQVKVTRHKVAKGETIWDICKKYRTTVKRLTELNDWPLDKVSLAHDQLIVVRRDAVEEAKTKTAFAKTEKNEVEASSIQKKQKAEKELKLAKEAKEIVLLKARHVGYAFKEAVPSALYASEGTKVIARQAKSYKTYHVSNNESIATIAQKTGVPVANLIAWNNLENSLLTNGQVLLIQ